MQLPENKSFVEQTAEYLRQQLLAGRWTEVLPAERELAGELQVARNTLRKAIYMLSEEGLLHIPKGKRRHYIIRKKGPAAPVVSFSQVVLLTDSELYNLSSHTLLRVDLIRRALVGSDINFKVLTSRAFNQEQPSAALRELVVSNDAALWILHHATEPIQRWFQSEKIPAIIFGTAFPGVSLPSFSTDMAASMRHAMGLLRKQGHSSLVLVESEQALAGNLRVRAVMQEQAAQWKKVRSLVWTGDQTAFPLAVKAMMNSAHAPTAFVLMQSSHGIVLYSTFCHLGLRIPADASVVALFDDPSLTRGVPALAHYRENAEVESRRMVALIRHMLRGSMPTRFAAVLQEFVPGGSIAPPPP